MRVLRDPYTNKHYVMFYCTKLVGGGVLDPNAIRLLDSSIIRVICRAFVVAV